jgi:hypothetical protein
VSRSGSPRRGGGAWRLAQAAGLVLAAAGVAVVLRPLLAGAGALRERLAAGTLAGALAGGAAAFALLTLAMAAAWWWLLAWRGPRPPFRVAFAVWARSQVAKYLPGNVFHYVGRQLLARRAGLGQAAVAGAGVLELASVLAAAAAGIALDAAAAGGRGALPRAALAGAAAVVAAGAVVAGGWALRRLRVADDGAGRDRSHGPPRGAAGWLALLAPAAALHAAFLAGSGLLVAALARFGFGAEGPGWLAAAGAYPLAWAAGVLALGAPAGLGVRDAVLALELAPALGAETAAAVALAFRLATVAGELLLAAAGWAAGGLAQAHDGLGEELALGEEPVGEEPQPP